MRRTPIRAGAQQRALTMCMWLLCVGALGCDGGPEPAPDGGQDAGHWVTCCIDNRYAQCRCLSENCDGPFIANCGPGVCVNYIPSFPMSNPCEGVE